MKGKNPLELLVKRARELGAVSAKIVAGDSIVTAPWVRMKCQFGCGRFSTSYCCPPQTPTPEQTRAVIDCYEYALLIHCQGGTSSTEIAVQLERKAFLSGFYKALGFGAGPCRLCKKCHIERCIHPYEARPAMEACGIDVFATPRGNGFPVEVLKDYSCEENRYGLVLID